MQDHDHDCSEHVEYHEECWTETHGLDCGPYEHCRDVWWECSICHAKFTSEELDKQAQTV